MNSATIHAIPAMAIALYVTFFILFLIGIDLEKNNNTKARIWLWINSRSILLCYFIIVLVANPSYEERKSQAMERMTYVTYCPKNNGKFISSGSSKW